jgi:hypothetical protein
MKITNLSIDLLKIDANTQSRVAVDPDTVDTYADLIIETPGEWPLGPLDVFHDGTDYFVSDGFHRTLAAARTKRASIPCRIHKGTAHDARIFGMTANDKHGLRMTSADKRHCVVWLLENGGKMTQSQIAEKAGVTDRTVKRIVADRKPPVTVQTTVQKGTMSPSVDPPKPSKPTEQTQDDPEESEPEESEPVETGPTSAAPRNPPSKSEATNNQRLKTVKTVEALMRAFDDLNEMKRSLDDHHEAIERCKVLLQVAKGWK